MVCRLLLVPMLMVMALTTCSGAFGSALNYPEAPMPPPDQLVSPAGETIYFPMRPDFQAFILSQDVTVNLTSWLDRYYFNPKWRGEEWGPFNGYWIVERQCRIMPTWQEYDQQSLLRVGNKYAKFLEKYSGYGP